MCVEQPPIYPIVASLILKVTPIRIPARELRTPLLCGTSQQQQQPWYPANPFYPIAIFVAKLSNVLTN